VTNALIGMLVREGKLTVDEAAPVPAWQNASDPRHNITVEQLMRMIRASTWTKPAVASTTSNQTVRILARIVRDKVGGNANAIQRFAFEESFEPLGMCHVTMEMDGTGTPVRR
jgi:hypothetical protein